MALVVEQAEPGIVLVQVADEPPRAARLTSAALAPSGALPAVGAEVLLVHDGGDPARPIVLATLLEPSGAVPSEAVAAPHVDRPVHAVVDGRRVTIRAQDEIELKCGRGCIRIQRDGRIVVRGSDLLQRASGGIRIKGGHVDIN